MPSYCCACSENYQRHCSDPEWTCLINYNVAVSFSATFSRYAFNCYQLLKLAGGHCASALEQGQPDCYKDLLPGYSASFS
jgi:hypothetical protein